MEDKLLEFYYSCYFNISCLLLKSLLFFIINWPRMHIHYHSLLKSTKFSNTLINTIFTIKLKLLVHKQIMNTLLDKQQPIGTHRFNTKH